MDPFRGEASTCLESPRCVCLWVRASGGLLSSPGPGGLFLQAPERVPHALLLQAAGSPFPGCSKRPWACAACHCGWAFPLSDLRTSLARGRLSTNHCTAGLGLRAAVACRGSQGGGHASREPCLWQGKGRRSGWTRAAWR